MTKGGKQEVAAVGHNSYAGTRFNAVKHAVLSRYTVLPCVCGAFLRGGKPDYLLSYSRRFLLRHRRWP
jgi:hypothetical protein